MKSASVTPLPASPASLVGMSTVAEVGHHEAAGVGPQQATVLDPTSPERAPRLRVCVADGHGLVLRALGEVIREQPDLVLVGEATTEERLFASGTLAECDVLVVDLSLGPKVIERARLISPELFVVAHSILPRDPFEGVALRAGASAFVAKGAHPAALLGAIRQRRRP